MKKQIKPLEACRLDLFTSEDELREKYSEPIALRVLRIREEYNWFLSNPDATPSSRHCCHTFRKPRVTSTATATTR